MLSKIEIMQIVKIAKEAGIAILDVFNRDFSVDYKRDSSPLTEADEKAHNIIKKALLDCYPEIPVLSEEGKMIHYSTRKNWDYLWLVDPLDGTKEFIKRNKDFTVNIALIKDSEPVLGVVYAPALDVMYFAKNGEGAFKMNGNSEVERLPVIINRFPEENMTVVASKSHMSLETELFINDLKNKTKALEIVNIGSSLKFCLVAEGSADIYPRLGPTMEWDTAAADAIVRSVGRSVIQYENGKSKQLVYNKESLQNPWFIVM